MTDDDDGSTTTLLNAIIFGHVGKTLFGYKLAETINSDISNRRVKVATVAAPKAPKVYKDIKKCTDRQTRDEMINNLSKSDQTELLIYALCEKKDNKELIETVANLLKDGMPEGTYLAQLNSLMSAPDIIDKDNWAALVGSNTTTGNNLRMIFPNS